LSSPAPKVGYNGGTAMVSAVAMANAVRNLWGLVHGS
jgi:hypothetical protein